MEHKGRQSLLPNNPDIHMEAVYIAGIEAEVFQSGDLIAALAGYYPEFVS